MVASEWHSAKVLGAMESGFPFISTLAYKGVPTFTGRTTGKAGILPDYALLGLPLKSLALPHGITHCAWGRFLLLMPLLPIVLPYITVMTRA